LHAVVQEAYVHDAGIVETVPSDSLDIYPEQA
jgi:hypothetical protein